MLARVVKRVVAAVALTMSLSATSVGGQEQASLTFYHGRNGDSRILSGVDGRSNTSRKNRFKTTLPVGAEVCVVVVNAHPANYAYAMGAVIDTTGARLPDVSTFNTFINALPTVAAIGKAFSAASLLPTDTAARTLAMKLTGVSDTGSVRVQGAPLARLDTLLGAFKTLADEVTKATEAADKSDSPGTYREGTRTTTGGFREAVESIAALPKEKLHFNDPKLKDNLQALVTEAKREAEQAGADSKMRDIVTGLAGYAELLLVKRDQLKSAYASTASAAPRICKTVVEGKNTFSLTIAKKGETGERDVTPKDSKGGDFFTLEVQSRFERKVVSVDPLSLMVLTWNVPQFQVQGDTLLAPSTNPTLARPGLMLSINPVSWGTNGDWGFGIGLGLGVSTSNAVTDALAGATVTFRNSIRFGVGYGRSKQHESVKGAVVGQPLPANLGKLEDAVQSGGLTKDAVYFLITVPGIALKTK